MVRVHTPEYNAQCGLQCQIKVLKSTLVSTKNETLINGENHIQMQKNFKAQMTFPPKVVGHIIYIHLCSFQIDP